MQFLGESLTQWRQKSRYTKVGKLVGAVVGASVGVAVGAAVGADVGT